MSLLKWDFLYGLFAGSSIYAILQWIYNSKLRKNKKINLMNQIDDCIFFSPKMYTVQCVNDAKPHCELLSCPFCNYKKFLGMIGSAKLSLDVCIYLITSDEVANKIVHLFRTGVFVRVIIDKQMSDEALNSKVYVFMKEHIPIKMIKNGEMMHNKFVIIDQEKLITGSFNWTKQGMFYNYENGVIICNRKIVKKFVDYFQNMWLTTS